ncbi:MAG: hypothetical protein HFJ27_04890 [Clostridia bacterium]|nr:hypothetical protein [Clostridia bacterium]
MKSNSGITTTSMIVYVIAMIIVIGTIATITSFFYTNVTQLEDNSNYLSEITKFHMYFLEETTKRGNSINLVTNSSISFSDGNTFSFQDNAIYYNHTRICEMISNLEFSVESVENKKLIDVLITIGEGQEYTKTTRYVINENM